MERTALLHTDYLDILFHNRNKIYGGYELRKHYPDRVRKAFFTVLFLVSSLGGLQLYASLHKHRTFSIHKPETVVRLRHIDVDKVYAAPTPPPPSRAVAPPKVAPTVSNPVIKIVEDHRIIDNPPKTSDELKGKTVGANDNPGNGGTQPDLGGKAGNGTGDLSATGTGTAPSIAASASPVRWVEQMPTFDGSLEDYLQKNLRYPEMARESGVQGKVILEFIVNEEGEVSAIKLERGIGGGCDEEAIRVVKNMPRWHPGKQNGRAVNVLMTLPVVFSLD